MNVHTKIPENFLATEWAEKLGAEFTKPYMEKLRQFLKFELQKGREFFPPKDKIFRALKLVDYSNVRVVILGQDPYHGEGQANGLAFAVSPHIPAPPSLQNIFKEVANSFPPPKNFKFNTTLEGWAMQGVLCLNTVLTVRKNVAFSHRDKGWENFTDKVIECLMEKPTPVVFLCWGSAATQKVERVKQEALKIQGKIAHHLILKAPHPSPLSAHRGFLGCGHFLKTNEFLKKQNLMPIDWLNS